MDLNDIIQWICVAAVIVMAIRWIWQRRRNKRKCAGCPLADECKRK